MTAQHVTWSRCPRCRMVVLATDTEESLPTVITGQRLVDPTPISLPEETACVLTGRPTWAWAWQFAVHRLDLRDPVLYWGGHDQETPATRPVVLPEHLCGGRFTTCLPAAATARRTPAQPTVAPSHQPDLFEAADVAREESLDQCPF
ncbi:hypothetical protein F8O06_02810 [Pseudoclavibacter sp. CFCC 14310]|uniref:hypothetical protein n=1 Tax=Pseudoclavibacter sp. CFCC 14310 TaxID=2615180 RepID=UPI0013018810|nr:hypothetical protein [Pseudoclavibacter sp. CFCC 14310]KAB1647488.1 hypothetical protein F8O06_02810 [Pseudoclavibacter sp. CFCC 14310]